jgi:hypothetical protein
MEIFSRLSKTEVIDGRKMPGRVSRTPDFFAEALCKKASKILV